MTKVLEECTCTFIINQSELSKASRIFFLFSFIFTCPQHQPRTIRPTILSNDFHSIGDIEYNFDYIVISSPRSESKTEVDWDCFYTKAEWNDPRQPPSDWINGRLTIELTQWYRPIHPFHLEQDPCSVWVSWTRFNMTDQATNQHVPIKTLGLTSDPWPADKKPVDLEIMTAWDYNTIVRKIEEEGVNTNILDETIRLGSTIEATAEISEAVATTLKPILDGIISKIDNAVPKTEASGSLSGAVHVNTALTTLIERFDKREKRLMEEEEERKAKRQKLDEERQAKQAEKEKQQQLLLQQQQAGANQFFGGGRGRGGRGGFNQGNRNYGFPAGSNGYFSGNFPINGNEGASNNSNSALEKMAKDIETLAAKVAAPPTVQAPAAPAAPAPQAVALPVAPPLTPAAVTSAGPSMATPENLEALIQPMLQRALENQAAQQVETNIVIITTLEILIFVYILCNKLS